MRYSIVQFFHQISVERIIQIFTDQDVAITSAKAKRLRSFCRKVQFHENEPSVPIRETFSVLKKRSKDDAEDYILEKHNTNPDPTLMSTLMNTKNSDQIKERNQFLEQRNQS